MQLQTAYEPVRPFFEQYEMARLTLAMLAEEETPESPVTTPSLFTDDQLRAVVAGVLRTSTLANMLLSRDLAIISIIPTLDHAATLAEITKRADALRQFNALRPKVSARAPRIGLFWTDTVQYILDETIAASDAVVAAGQARTIKPQPIAKAWMQLAALVPLIFGEIRRVSDDVLAFCATEDLSQSLVLACKAAKESFPDAREPVFEVADDPEGDSAWITIRITVPKDQSLARYNRYVSEIVRLIPGDDLHKIRFDYVPV